MRNALRNRAVIRGCNRVIGGGWSKWGWMEYSGKFGFSGSGPIGLFWPLRSERPRLN
ncbi:hypothetical protein C8R31_103178 [Nitrosospira sp. Nsp2]|nr:hypothetical protein C8R31_103178 [Nitrosospira sp. Nsp2]